MKSYDAEVAIQNVDNLNAKVFFDGLMYVTDQRDKAEPLYFAPYLTRTVKVEDYESPYYGIRDVSRVRWVADLNVEELLEKDLDSIFSENAECREKWMIGLDIIKERARKESWQRVNRLYLYFLDEPFTLLKDPLTKESKLPVIPSMIPKGFSLTFEQLLKSVR